MKLFVPKERLDGETRVAIVPETVKKLIAKLKLEIHVESGAGEGAHIADKEFEAAGATVGAPQWDADMVTCIREPSLEDVGKMKEGALLIGLLNPWGNHDLIKKLAEKKISSIPMEMIPRTTLAQSMDVLSSQASIAGYKAVLMAATKLDRYFPLLMTAAGTIKPARVVIMGAGVAGLQAIATAKRLGAIVEVSDIRAEVEEQVKSLGGKFIPLPDLQKGEESGGYAKEVTPEFLAKQREIVAQHIAQANVVITTALVPGRPAPKLVSADMVKSMRTGSVIVDLAVIAGGNCELSELDKEVVKEGVLIIGHSNLPATQPADASVLFARNVLELLLHMHDKEGNFSFNFEDEIVDGAVTTHEGKIRNERVNDAINRSAA
ncbi:MAG: Re/Si-specific NAD(P)(+) transhydrogenase subunit alpha [Deltaproteobacteria bacterium]|nr:Re/Si-specific NAD(P)(+) transhydrogenase subunit alpha [Deltaproteobacteria bacterium]